MSVNCPVCGKAGLPDYRKEEVICPACDTNLKAYRLFNKIEKTQKSKINWVLLAILPLLIILPLLFIFFRENHYGKLQYQYNERIALLNDTISSLREEKMGDVYKEPVVKQDTAFIYTIKPGDSFCRISLKIYGTERHARNIAETNQMKLSSKLFAGKEIIIPPI